MATIKIPDELKSDVPQSGWGKILTATPVILTVVATALAGLASSEMTRAQYSRSLAAQQQSKAGDQWGFFQAKRLRSALQRNTLDLLQSTTELRPIETAALEKAGAEAKTVAALQLGQLPEIAPATALDPNLQAVLEAIDTSKPPEVVMPLVAKVKDPALEEALRAARDRAEELDSATTPVNRAIEKIENQLSREGGSTEARRDFIAARLRYASARYDTEARLNQAIANLYEVQVRRSNLTADRHRTRSQRFFYGMLGAQAGVIIATFSLAARKRSLLWTLAAAAGAAAISFAVYVYLFV
jgi:hypothetical protein